MLKEKHLCANPAHVRMLFGLPTHLPLNRLLKLESWWLLTLLLVLLWNFILWRTWCIWVFSSYVISDVGLCNFTGFVIDLVFIF